jgi:hypothetical protein
MCSKFFSLGRAAISSDNLPEVFPHTIEKDGPST